MSRTLTLIHAGWASARTLARTGRRTEALAQLERLLTHPDLPAILTADVRRLAAELELGAGRFARARRHLRAATVHEPDHARTHYLLGVAWEEDPHGDDRRAAVRFRKAARLDPENPLYWAVFGRAAVRCDRVKCGVRALLAAADMAQSLETVPTVRIIVEGLLEAGRVTTAQGVLTKVRFLCPGNREVNTLWERVRFEVARLQQNTRKTQDAATATDGDIIRLPFIRLVGSAPGRMSGAGTIRRDRMSQPRPHLRFSRADR